MIESLKPGVTVGELAELTRAGRRSHDERCQAGGRRAAKLNMHGRGQGDDGPIITPHAKSGAAVGGGDAREYGFYLQAIGDLRGWRTYLPMGRYASS